MARARVLGTGLGLGLALALVLALGSEALAQQTQCVTNALAGGTGDAITVPLLPCGLATNLLLLTTANPNTTTAPTLQMPGFPAQTITSATGVPLAVGALPGNGAVVLLTSTGTGWRLLADGTPGATLAVNQVSTVTSGSTFVVPVASQIVNVEKATPSATSIVLPAKSNWVTCTNFGTGCPVITVVDGGGNAASGAITVTAADGAVVEEGNTRSVLSFNWQSKDYALVCTQWVVK